MVVVSNSVAVDVDVADTVYGVDVFYVVDQNLINTQIKSYVSYIGRY